MLLYSAFEDVRFSDRVVRVNLIAPVERVVASTISAVSNSIP